MKLTTTKPRKTTDILGNKIGTGKLGVPIPIWNMEHKISVQARGP